MNICIVGEDINQPSMWVEGVSKLAYELSRQFVKIGHSIHIVTKSETGPTNRRRNAHAIDLYMSVRARLHNFNSQLTSYTEYTKNNGKA